MARSFGLPDLRTFGSNSTGTTNALRAGSKPFALMVLIIDLLKGMLAIFFAKYYGLSGQMLGWVLFCVVLGHVYPVFFRFQGGKGVATLFGGLLIAAPLVSSVAFSLWLLTARFTKTASLASLLVATCLPWLAYQLDYHLFYPLCACSGFLFWTHRDNIKRLRECKELRL